MTIEEVKKIVEMHNDKVDNFLNNALPHLLKIAGINIVYHSNGKWEVSMNDYFKVQEFISCMNFYNEAKEICNMVRPLGYNVKINMQCDKLVMY